jgi:[ribosomal protein S18]-alanine N-acetyltransferase
MMAALEIRPMGAEDIPRVLDLERRTQEAPHWDPAAYEGFRDDAGEAGTVRKAAWVALEMAELVGFAAVQLILDVCDLESIFVVESRRGQGVGHALFATAAAWARDQGAGRLQLEVRSGHRAAVRFYERAGMRREGVRPGYYRAPDEDALLMGLDF